MEIKTVADFREALSIGPFTSIGSYPFLLYCDDGEPICHNCAKENQEQIEEAIREKEDNGWRIQWADVYYEGAEQICCNCNKVLESAYGDPWAKEE
jgi:hypothetical protein